MSARRGTAVGCHATADDASSTRAVVLSIERELGSLKFGDVRLASRLQKRKIFFANPTTNAPVGKRCCEGSCEGAVREPVKLLLSVGPLILKPGRCPHRRVGLRGRFPPIQIIYIATLLSTHKVLGPVSWTRFTFRGKTKEEPKRRRGKGFVDAVRVGSKKKL